MVKGLTASVLIYLWTSAALGSELWVHVNGGSYHPQHRGEFQEQHPGLGLTIASGNTLYVANVYQDSNGDPSAMVGYGKRAGWTYLQGEVVVGLMHRKDVQARTGAAAFPYVLPFLVVGNGDQRMRFGYVPRTPVSSVPVFTWQYLVKW